MQKVYFMYGIAIMLPNAATIASLPYFAERLSEYKPQFVFPLATNCVLTLVMLAVTLFGSKIAYFKRVNMTFVIQAIIMLLLPTITAFLPGSIAFPLCFVMLMI
jgi:F0F1-type ATP synthase assembly protein I